MDLVMVVPSHKVRKSYLTDTGVWERGPEKESTLIC